MADEKITTLYADTAIRLAGFERDAKRLESLREKTQGGLDGKPLEARVAGLKSDAGDKSTERATDAIEKQADAVEKVNAEIDKQERKTRKVTAETKNSAVALDGVAGKALKAVAVMGTLELAAGAVNVAFEVMNGDIENAAMLLEQLPAGIGPFARQLKGVLGNVTGIAQEIKGLDNVNRAMSAAMDAQLATSAKRLEVEREILDTINQQERRRLELTLSDGSAKDESLAGLDDEQRVEELRRRREDAKNNVKANSTSGEAIARDTEEAKRLADIKDTINSLENDTLKTLSRATGAYETRLALLKQEKKEIEAARQERAKQNAEDRKLISFLDEQIPREEKLNELAKQRREAERNAASKERIQEQAKLEDSLRRDNEAKQAEADGRILDAQVIRINATYDAKLLAAKTAAEKELIEISRTLDLEDAKRDDMARKEDERNKKIAARKRELDEQRRREQSVRSRIESEIEKQQAEQERREAEARSQDEQLARTTAKISNVGSRGVEGVGTRLANGQSLESLAKANEKPAPTEEQVAFIAKTASQMLEVLRSGGFA